ncbi:FecR domain-containing protein [Sphingomonas sp. LHG3406-1]|uniref:FecR family protein n=1 Tax=Sphingomonas sp. LHG3406-1 TaxID=2804617 RepID=UPI00261A208B|nr:FecR domain-containing protein [Sphingomonas sp. LHG3406-1]
MNQRHSLREEALNWLVRTNDPEFCDWDGFTAWLEQDRAHAEAYHRLAASELEMTPIVAEQAMVQDNVEAPQPDRRRVWLIAGLSVAASVAGLVSFQTLKGEQIITRPGEQRTIAMASGNELVLNGDTAITIAGWSKDKVRLERGQALFRLAGKDRLIVKAGELELVDIGTEFEVTRNGARTHVVVSEGAVLVDPGGAELKLDAGQQLDAADGATRLRSTAAPAGVAGAWARGQLVYVDAPVREVAADLRRSTGQVFTTNSAFGGQRFTGTLNLADVRRDPTTLGPLLGVSVRPAREGWQLGED